jgi:hypothetical protein
MNSPNTWLGYVELGNWHGPAAAGVRIILILAGNWIAQRVAIRQIRAFRKRAAADMTDTEQVRRAETLGRMFRYFEVVGVATRLP